MFHQMGLDALIVIGGDGTLAIASGFCHRGIPVVGVPKTIDNDIVGTTNCFGFDTAVDFATDAIDRLHTTAEAHHRIMIVEVMGRYAGWIALYAGVAGGADAILIPEIPFDIAIVAQRLRERDAWGAKFSIVVVAEGAFQKGGRCRWSRRRATATRNGSAESGRESAKALARETGKETRSVVLGHLAARRCADELRSRAGDAVRRQGGRARATGEFGTMVAYRPARYRGAAPRRNRGEDQDRPARSRSAADGEGARRQLRRLNNGWSRAPTARPAAPRQRAATPSFDTATAAGSSPAAT